MDDLIAEDQARHAFDGADDVGSATRPRQLLWGVGGES